MVYFRRIEQILASIPTAKIRLYEGKSGFCGLTRADGAGNGSQSLGPHPTRISGIALVT
jgi:hypothetical protein